MKANRIVLLKQTTEKPAPAPDTLVTDMDTVKRWVKEGRFYRHLWRYREAQGLTYHVEMLAKPFAFALLLRLLSRGKCTLADLAGNSQPVTIAYLCQLALDWGRDFLGQRSLLRVAKQESTTLLAPEQGPQTVQLNLAGRPVYCRTDLVFGLQSGGSIGHIAGVLNHLAEFSGKPLFITTDRIPTVSEEIERVQVWPDHRFREFNDLRALAFNHPFFTQAMQQVARQPVAFVYQRYSLNNYAGLKLARTLRVPFVLEYNGSEIWMNRHWGKSLAHEELAESIELTNLRGAHLIVVVSQPLKDDLVAREVEPAKILVNPNGVDPTRYAPEIDGSAVRKRYSLDDKTVIGFIGTFGPWHGADVLAAAFAQLLSTYPAYRGRAHLLMIGDGVTMPQVRESIARNAIEDDVTLTGIVPQREGPAHLAACDILASPHVPNPDGTPFFGSPTKLFEYMAMGKGIVASDLEQIGEILHHDQTAWLVKPGDPASLMEGLKRLIDDSGLRQRLGEGARSEVVQRFTWRAHTQHIITALQARVQEAHALQTSTVGRK